MRVERLMIMLLGGVLVWALGSYAGGNCADCGGG
jgi:hypothetical protein